MKSLASFVFDNHITVPVLRWLANALNDFKFGVHNLYVYLLSDLSAHVVIQTLDLLFYEVQHSRV